MKLHILSDLHLGFGAMDRPLNDADVVILAGDISRPREAVAWAMRFERPVLYVLGNHEFYGSSIEGARREARALCRGSRVHLLDDDEVLIGGVRFLGTTLWTDFRLSGDDAADAEAKAQGRRLLRDFSRIHAGDSADTLFAPDDAAALFGRQSRWLAARLAVVHDGPTVVVTHHAPSPRSVHPRFEGSPLNACFVSAAEHLFGAGRVDLWVHGHTHDSFDYRVGGTRVVCNPRGYAKGGVNENAMFDPDFVVDLGPASSID